MCADACVVVVWQGHADGQGGDEEAGAGTPARSHDARCPPPPACPRVAAPAHPSTLHTAAALRRRPPPPAPAVRTRRAAGWQEEGLEADALKPHKAKIKEAVDAMMKKILAERAAEVRGRGMG